MTGARARYRLATCETPDAAKPNARDAIALDLHVSQGFGDFEINREGYMVSLKYLGGKKIGLSISETGKLLLLL